MSCMYVPIHMHVCMYVCHVMSCHVRVCVMCHVIVIINKMPCIMYSVSHHVCHMSCHVMYSLSSLVTCHCHCHPVTVTATATVLLFLFILHTCTHHTHTHDKHTFYIHSYSYMTYMSCTAQVIRYGKLFIAIHCIQRCILIHRFIDRA